MTLQIPDITETELQNALGIVPPGDDEIQVVIGCSSKGTTGVLAAYANVPALVGDFGYGPMVEEAARSLEDSDGTPVYVYRTPSTNPGTVGTVNVAGVTGTAVLSINGAPYDDGEGYVICTTPGTIGVAPGPGVKWSLDNGRTLSAETFFGVGDTVAIPNSNLVLQAEPGTSALTALNTLINDLFSKQNAHVILTTGTVHTSADSADVLSSGTYPSATTTATRVARINAVCAVYELHRVKGSGASIHINAPGDTVDGLSILTAATDDESALARALDLQAKLTLHEAGTTWHTIADATNVVTDPAPAAGTLNLGDLITFPCVAPKWATADLTAAFAALVAGQQTFGFVQIAGPVSSTEAAVVASGLDSLRAVHKPSWAIVGARGPNAATSETDGQWSTAIEADYANTFRPDLAVCAGTAWVTSAITGFQMTRRITGSVAAVAVVVAIYVDLSKVALGPLQNLVMFDSNKNPICHNEAVTPGLMNARFIALRTFATKGEAPYICNPVLMSTPGSDFDLVQKRRVMNVLERTIYDFGLTLELNAEGDVDPTTGFIKETSARDVEIDMIEAITEALGAAVSDPDDPLMFVLSRTDPVLTNGGQLTAASRIVPLFYIKNLAVTTGFAK